jgi:hypothetical protein
VILIRPSVLDKDAEFVMVEYVWRHDLKGESNRLRLMSDLLDPSSEFHLLRTRLASGGLAQYQLRRARHSL